MIYNKIFYPLAGGNELKERLYGALSIAKYFNTHLEIMKSTPGVQAYDNMMMPNHIVKDFEHIIRNNFKQENEEFSAIIKELANEMDIPISDEPLDGKASISLLFKSGDRSLMAAQESKYCDCVIVASPPEGHVTATFEGAVMNSGRPVLMFPRVMKKFDAKSILVGWNNSPEASKALNLSLPLLKKASKVHIVTAKQYVAALEGLGRLQSWLSSHGIETTTGMITPTMHAGEALLGAAQEGNFDMIVAGAYSRNGLKELMLGGATQYLLTHTDIPVFMAH